jgi:hypothetical protein
MVTCYTIKKMVLFFILLILVIPACNSTTETEPVYNAQSFFPLSIGSKWSYHHHNSSDKTGYVAEWEAIGKKELSGNIFTQIAVYVPSKNGYDTIFYRFRGDTLSYISTYVKNEEVIADFSLSLNDTCWWDKELTVTEKSDDIFTVASEFHADYGYSLSFKRGTGITKLISNGFIYYQTDLIKAEIKI